MWKIFTIMDVTDALVLILSQNEGLMMTVNTVYIMYSTLVHLNEWTQHIRVILVYKDILLNKFINDQWNYLNPISGFKNLKG